MHYESLIIPLAFLLIMGGGGMWAANRESKARHKAEDREKDRMKSVHDRLGRL